MKQYQLLKSLCIFMGVICLTGIMASTDCLGQSYPSKPITIIIPSGVGGGGDTVTRIIALSMQKDLGVTIVIKNMPGAGSTIGLSAAWRAKPDGYTICMFYAQNTSSAQIYRKKVIFDTKKFTVIARTLRTNYMLVVPKNSPFRSLSDFKKAEKPIRSPCTSFTSAPARTAILLAKEYGFPVTLVSGYPGVAGQLLGMLKGEVDIDIAGANLNPYIKSGEIIPLLYLTMERSKIFPSVPCIKDFGLPEYLSYIAGVDCMFYGPPGMPENKVKILEKAILKAVNENAEKFDKMGWENRPLPSDKAREFLFQTYDIVAKYSDIK